VRLGIMARDATMSALRAVTSVMAQAHTTALSAARIRTGTQSMAVRAILGIAGKPVRQTAVRIRRSRCTVRPTVILSVSTVQARPRRTVLAVCHTVTKTTTGTVNARGIGPVMTVGSTVGHATQAAIRPAGAQGRRPASALAASRTPAATPMENASATRTGLGMTARSMLGSVMLAATAVMDQPMRTATCVFRMQRRTTMGDASVTAAGPELIAARTQAPVTRSVWAVRDQLTLTVSTA
jgi:hypothetical protein